MMKLSLSISVHYMELRMLLCVKTIQVPPPTCFGAAPDRLNSTCAQKSYLIVFSMHILCQN